MIPIRRACARAGSAGADLVRLLLRIGTGALLSMAASAAELRLNDIQLLGSHNSYKQAMAPDRMAALRAVNPQLAQALDYEHPPLPEQLELGLRKLELDVFYDPGGELFGRAETPAGAHSAFPVLHVQNLDDRSHCANLLHCLERVRAWARQHDRHLPLFVSINAKDAVVDQPGFIRPLAFGEDAWTALDAELRAALGERLLSPAAVFDGERLDWPALSQARGRVLVVLDEGGGKRRSYASRWRERAMFTTVDAGEPGAAILIVNDPLADFERIRSLVAAGYIVRTRADADTVEARSGDTTRRDAAWASGAQLISTDYYLPAGRLGTDYQVTVPGGGVGRCNPLRVAEACTLNATQD